MAPVRVGNLSPARRQKIVANVRAGQAAFNQLNANLRREEQLVNNIEKLHKEKRKMRQLIGASPSVHPYKSNAHLRNSAINERLRRNIERKNHEIQRLEANLVALRRRLFERPSGYLSNQTILEGMNFSGRKAQLNRMRFKRLARLITAAYLKPGGMFSRKLVNNVRRVANSRNA